MATVVLNAYSKAYPSITNRIKVSITKQENPYAIVASEIDNVPGHPARIWSFPGLPRANYGFSMDVIDAGGLPLANLATFAVVPGEINGMLTRADEQIQVGTTVGLVAGDTSVLFNGEDGRPDYVGWEITVSEMYQRGIMQKGSVDFTWDSSTGLFSFVEPGDMFYDGQWYNIHFSPNEHSSGGSAPTVLDFSIALKTVSTTLVDSDFGKKIIVEPASPYIELTLPAIATVPEGRPLMIESSTTGIHCTRLIFPTGIVKWLRGNVYIMQGESLRLYVYSRAGVPEWRVDSADGNFANVGTVVSDDNIPADVFNKHLLDGEIVSIEQYARIYNEHVLNLPLDQVVDFDSWGTGNNFYFYSRANSSNPIYANMFRFPDRRGLVSKSAYSPFSKAGDFEDDQVGESTFNLSLTTGDTFLNHPYPPTAFGKGLAANSPVVLSPSVTINSGNENLVKTVAENKYVLI